MIQIQKVNTPMSDIQDKDDIKILVDAFYKKVLEDEVIGFIFTQTVKFIWEKHIPTMYDFWDSTLFHTSIYRGNPMQKHIVLNDKIELTNHRFERWLSLWESTVDENFKGKKAKEAKEKARTIGEIMKYKIKVINAT